MQTLTDAAIRDLATDMAPAVIANLGSIEPARSLLSDLGITVLSADPEADAQALDAELSVMCAHPVASSLATYRSSDRPVPAHLAAYLAAPETSTAPAPLFDGDVVELLSDDDMDQLAAELAIESLASDGDGEIESIYADERVVSLSALDEREHYTL